MRRLLDRDPARRERQQAAAALLCGFREETAGAAAVPWQAFANGLTIVGHPWRTRWMRREVIAAARCLDPGHVSYWTRGRLRRFDRQIQNWRRLQEAGVLQHSTELRKETQPA